MQLLTNGNIFIQNSGTATQFAGLTVGGQGLLVGRYQASTNPDGTQSFSFTGTLTTADDVLYFDFTITGESEIVLRSYSYAGGTNGNGQQIPAGGFDPILSLFNAAGDLIASNDDGGSNVPTDPTTGNNYDVFLESLLPAGTYRVAVTAFSNFPAGDNLSEGFEGGGDFDERTANFAFDVIGADTVTRPGEDTPIAVVGFGRMQNADGSFTSGADFFQQVDFGIDSGVEYAEGSTFNGFAIGEPIPVPPPPPPPPAEPTTPPALTGPDAVLGGVAVVGSGSEPEPEDSDDGSGISVNTSTGLINTGTGGTDELLDEAVTSGGDTSQWIDDECLPENDQQQCKEGNN
ncbi:MAG: DVUA0089 family protein [Pseudomonadota bacterium]|nr:DVUA0089 family protein [Pseudomonadota bacterium]